MLKGTERGEIYFFFKEAEMKKGADAPVEGERKAKQKKNVAPAGNRTNGNRSFYHKTTGARGLRIVLVREAEATEARFFSFFLMEASE